MKVRSRERTGAGFTYNVQCSCNMKAPVVACLLLPWAVPGATAIVRSTVESCRSPLPG